MTALRGSLGCIAAAYLLFGAYIVFREPICAKTTLAAFLAPHEVEGLAAQIKPGQCDW